MKLHLISSKVCPFVQRSVILLKEKEVSHDITYIDLSNKPDWFLARSPRGKVPVLLVDDTVLFESQAICEFLDETQGQTRLMPNDPLLRARDRAWFAFAGEELFGPQYRLLIAPDQATYEPLQAQLSDSLTRLKDGKSGFWLSGNGETFGMADVAVAPFFTRLRLLERWTGRSWLASHAQLQPWVNALLERPSISQSVPSDFEREMRHFMDQHNAHLLHA